ncbi:MAG: protein-L-isoaspartate(D-aspartate) O-methyltransferase [Synergistetes bacterium]|nr:protein-L-isoaspartate(D-aspartate) O-methyltransferase [Synergistota bacterium]
MEEELKGWQRLAQEMVETQIAKRGIKDERVLAAMANLPRHLFVPPRLRDSAYDDTPLPIGMGQTISQPYMVALMTELLALKGDERVLEIGTGSGYQTAVLCKLCAQVYTVERIEELIPIAEENLITAGLRNFRIKHGDGSIGWEEEAPFDAIIVTAAAPEVPQSLVEQLGERGRMVVPIGERYVQDLMLLLKDEDGSVKKKVVSRCVFVPLIGKEGWKGDELE